MKKSYLSIIFILLLSSFHLQAQNWNLIWSDEFSGTSIDPSHWKHETGGHGWGNDELQYYTSQPQNSTVQNGELLIIARKEAIENRSYTSARLISRGLRSFQYGKIEARMKIPTGQGIWPAFWMLGESLTEVSWPACGEIDIMEHVNTEPNIYGTIHWQNVQYANYSGHTSYDSSVYHIYSVVWDKNSIKWFIDEVQYHEADISNNINGTEEFHAPFFLLLNLAIGGKWPGSPDESTFFPKVLAIDYVRVYQEKITGIQDVQNTLNTITVLPEPVQDKAAVQFHLEKGSHVKLSVCDVFGRDVRPLADAHFEAGRNELHMDITDLQQGIYFIKGTFEEKTWIEKIIKE